MLLLLLAPPTSVQVLPRIVLYCPMMGMITVVLVLKLPTLTTSPTAAFLITVDLGVHRLARADLEMGPKLNWQLVLVL